MSILFKQGLIVTATGSYVADLLVEGEKITTIGASLECRADEIVDARGKYLLPGAIDPHTHLCMPFMGTHAQDDYCSGTNAAACVGVTSLINVHIQNKGESILQGLEWE